MKFQVNKNNIGVPIYSGNMKSQKMFFFIYANLLKKKQ